jgi:hypothetical protein
MLEDFATGTSLSGMAISKEGLLDDSVSKQVKVKGRNRKQME